MNSKNFERKFKLVIYDANNKPKTFWNRGNELKRCGNWDSVMDVMVTRLLQLNQAGLLFPFNSAIFYQPSKGGGRDTPLRTYVFDEKNKNPKLIKKW